VYREGILGTDDAVPVKPFNSVYISNIMVAPGDSGSPVYITHGNKIELFGYVIGLIDGLSAIIPISNADKLLRDYRNSPLAQKKNLEQEINTYEYTEGAK
jgi:hypothetical protein